MSKFAHLKNKDGVIVYSEVLRDFVQLAHRNIFTNLPTSKWCEGIAMTIGDYAMKIVLGDVPLTAEDLTGICKFCGTPVKELLDEVYAMGKEVEADGGATFVWDMEEIRKSFEKEE